MRQDVLHFVVDHLKLVLPVRLVQQWPHVQPVVVHSFRLVVESWGDCCHFVPVHRVSSEEVLDLFGQSHCSVAIVGAENCVEHRHWAEFIDSPHVPEKM